MLLRVVTIGGWLSVFLAASAALMPVGAQDNPDKKKSAVPEVNPRAVFYAAKNYPYRVAITPDDKTVVSICSAGGGVRFWDVAKKAERTTGRHEGRIRSLAMSPDGKRVATGGFDDKKIILWDVATGKQLKAFTGHQERIIAVHFTPDGKRLVSAGVEGDVKIWDVAQGKEAGALFGRIRNIQKMDLSPDGKTLALLPGFRSASANLWDVANDKESFALEGMDAIHGGCPIQFTPDNKFVAVVNGGNKPRIQLWDVATGKPGKAILVMDSNVHSLAFSPDNKLVATGSDTFGHIALWDLATGKQIAALVGHTDMIEALAFSRDGKTLVSGSRDQRIRLWDVPYVKLNELPQQKPGAK